MDEIIKKALHIRFLSGPRNYNALLALGDPLPSEKTLRRTLEMLKFYPGISHVIELEIEETLPSRERFTKATTHSFVRTPTTKGTRTSKHKHKSIFTRWKQLPTI